MPDENDVPTEVTHGANLADVAIALINAVRDILNDWRVATALIIVVLLLAGKVAGGDLIELGDRWLRARRCQP